MLTRIDVTVFNIYWCLEDDGSLHITKSAGDASMYTDGTDIYYEFDANSEVVEPNKALFTRDDYFDAWFIQYYKTPENTASCDDIESEMMALMRQCLRETADAINDYLEGEII